MQFYQGKIYHVYNQGNNKQPIFFTNENYLYFLKAYRTLVAPHADTIAYCLMPNHFHFLISTNEQSVQQVKVGSLTLSALSNGIRMLLSSYATAINRQQHTTGSLFRQKTKAKPLDNGSDNYTLTAFHYIHQNPLGAKLVTSLNDWEYSSFKDYTGLRNGTLCNKKLAGQLIDTNWNDLATETYEFYKNKQDLSAIF
ncbi:transposase [Panacibacter ginsenosidivorans]|uniref:Transposase n=1 Tax=Panacibacter ginsenosidivorans TaxID=1813871 RepID=A0A5B8VB64_9BACT|nr:transposase [Panacibacter ginsenosidivorans]QEC68720.1 transposase [Panacibacter ginsenosidivorans]